MGAEPAGPGRLAAAVLGGIVGAGALAVLVYAFATRNGTASTDVFEQGASVVAAIAAVGLAVCVRPAWPLSIGLALGAFSGHWDEMSVPIPLDRLLIGSAIVSTLVRERARRVDGLRTRPVDLLLIVTSIYAIGSALLVGTLDEHDARFALIDRLSILGFVLFWVAPKAYREARDREIFLGTLVVLGAYLGLTALFETVGPEFLVFPDYILDPSVGTHIDRARGPFAEAAANGLILFSCGVASTLAMFTWQDPRRRRYAGAVAILCGLGIVLTVTRAAWLASGAGAIVALLVMRETRRFFVPAAALTALGVVLAFAVIPGLQGRAEERADDQPPLWDRRNSNAAAVRMIEDRPALGFGWGRFPVESQDFYRQSPDYPLTRVRDLHNVYLVNAVEMGLIGGGLWLLAVAIALGGSVLRRGPPELRLWRMGLIALATSYALSALSTPLGFALPTLLLWTWAGVTWADVGARQPAGNSASTTRRDALPSSHGQNRAANAS